MSLEKEKVMKVKIKENNIKEKIENFRKYHPIGSVSMFKRRCSQMELNVSAIDSMKKDSSVESDSASESSHYSLPDFEAAELLMSISSQSK